MSEGLERRREQQFRYLVNRSHEEDFNPSLFASLPPDKQERVEALLTNAAVEPNELLYPDYSDSAGAVRFLHGGIICGELQGELAEQIRIRFGSQVYFRVIGHDGVVLTLQACPTPRKRFREKP